MNYFPSSHSTLSGAALLALGEAVEATFDATAWSKFAHEVDEATYVLGHDRLLRSMRFGDSDYGAAVLQVLRYLAENRPTALVTLAQRQDVRTWLDRNKPTILVELGLTQTHVAPPTRDPDSSEVVERALSDADYLLHTNGAVSCVDRIHTALHGYLRDLCAKTSIQVAEDASITTVFKLLRTGHPTLQDTGPRAQEVGRVLSAMATIVDALNTLRNRASVAHANDVLLDEPEAMLMVNITRSLFHYLDERL